MLNKKTIVDTHAVFELARPLMEGHIDNWDGAGLIRELNEGVLLPQSFYTDESLVAKEWKSLLDPSWQYIGSRGALKKNGDFISGYCGKFPVVVVQDGEKLNGFLNVCRHRRHEVTQGSGNASRLQCPYHAWTYDLSGNLIAAPRCKSETKFDLEKLSLVPVQVETFGPLIFANTDLSAPSLSMELSPLREIIENGGLRLEDLVSHGQENWEANANWKVMIENYLECYHCPTQHPTFSKLIDVRPGAYELRMFEKFFSQIAPARGLHSLKINEKDFLYEAQYHFLFPNMTISINPGPPNLTIDVYLPDGPAKSRGVSEHFFGRSVSKSAADEITAFNRQVGIEDDRLTRSVQKSFEFPFPARSRALPESERLIIEFQKRVCTGLSTPTKIQQQFQQSFS